MAQKFALEGARRFASYLQELAGEGLTAEGPVKFKQGDEPGRRWEIKLNDAHLGDYYSFDPKPGNTHHKREYIGRIPGYINRTTGTDQVALTFSDVDINVVTEAFTDEKDGAKAYKGFRDVKTSTPWKRQDYHKAIPFP